MLVEFEAGGYTLRMKSILACVHGRSTDTAPAWRSPAERRPPDPPLHMRMVERGGGLHQPNGEVLGVIDRIDPREEARRLRHRPRRRRRLAVRRPRTALRHRKWNGYKPRDPESNPLGLVFLE